MSSFHISKALCLIFICVHFATYFLFFDQNTFPIMACHLLAIISIIFCLSWGKLHIKSSEDFFTLATKHSPLMLCILFFPGIPYIFMNFFVSMGLLSKGYPEIIDGSYYLVYRGTIVREIDPYEFKKLINYQIRLFSGHWIIAGILGVITSKLILNIEGKKKAKCKNNENPWLRKPK